MRSLRILLAVIGSVVVGAGTFFAALTMMMMISATVRSASTDNLPMPGSQAPDFQLSDPNGNPVRLSDFRGTPVVVVFWAEWCPDCTAIVPELNRIQANGTPVLGINLLESRARVLSAIEKKAIGYTVALDSDGEVGRKYGAQAIPNIFLIDAEGRIVEHRYTPPENF